MEASRYRKRWRQRAVGSRERDGIGRRVGGREIGDEDRKRRDRDRKRGWMGMERGKIGIEREDGWGWREERSGQREDGWGWREDEWGREREGGEGEGRKRQGECERWRERI